MSIRSYKSYKMIINSKLFKPIGVFLILRGGFYCFREKTPSINCDIKARLTWFNIFIHSSMAFNLCCVKKATSNMASWPSSSCTS